MACTAAEAEMGVTAKLGFVDSNPGTPPADPTQMVEFQSDTVRETLRFARTDGIRGTVAIPADRQLPSQKFVSGSFTIQPTPTDISRYQSKMTPEEYYEFAKARGKLLKEALMSPNDEGQLGLDHLLSLSDKAKSKDEDSPAKKYLMRISRSATRRALVQVGFKGEPETPAP